MGMGGGNEDIEVGGNWYEKSVPAHLYFRALGDASAIAAPLVKLREMLSFLCS